MPFYGALARMSYTESRQDATPFCREVPPRPVLTRSLLRREMRRAAILVGQEWAKVRSTRQQPPGECRATALGWPAQQQLRPGSQAAVCGATSHGLFLQTSQGVVFLSTEALHGPLTVNLASDLPWLSAAAQDSACEIERAALRLLPSGVAVRLEQATLYRTPRRAAPSDPPADQRQRFSAMVRHLPPPPSQNGMASLAKWIAQDLPAATRPSHAQAERCARLGRAIAAGDAAGFASESEGLLGWGQGLTPSGDDFVLGVLLALSRDGHGCAASSRLLEAAARLIEGTAGNRTTAISAGLLACAASGEADERLIAVVDHIQSGLPGMAEAQDAASSWGATSGWDAFAGIGLTLHRRG